MKRFMVGIALVLVAVGLGWVGYQRFRSKVVEEQKGAQKEEVVGGDEDEHGCKGSAGYSWCDQKQKCLRVWEEGCPEAGDGEAIRQALWKKNKWGDQEELSFQVNTNDGRYAKGMVNGQGGGGLWFAAKVNGEWKIVADGNGIIACESLVEYIDFPKTLIPSCYDTKKGTTVTR